MATAVHCERLVKRFGEVVALDGLYLDVPSGVVFGFLGPNGSGKTTTIRLLTGLDTPTSGTATVAGMDMARSGPSARQRIGYMPQQPQFYGWMRGRELLEFVGETFGFRGKALRTRVDEMLELTGLTDAAKRRVSGYSGGMKQRLGLAQALINEPEIVFLDEPASALDPAGRRDVLDIIASLRGRTTVFMSTHILADVERVCDVVAIVNQGRLVVDAPLAELQAQYAQPIFLLEPEPGQGAHVASLIEALGNQPWVSSVTVEHNEIRVMASDPELAIHKILPLVADKEVALSRMERARPDLEDIFLRLVGDGRATEQSQREVTA